MGPPTSPQQWYASQAAAALARAISTDADAGALEEADVPEGDLPGEHQELAHAPPCIKKRDLGLERTLLKNSKGVGTKRRAAVMQKWVDDQKTAGPHSDLEVDNQKGHCEGEGDEKHEEWVYDNV